MNKYLEKIAMSEQGKSDVVNTATLGAVGAGEIYGMSNLYKIPKFNALSGGAKLALNGGVTLAADYLGVKLGNKINQLRRGSPTPNVNTKEL